MNDAALLCSLAGVLLAVAAPGQTTTYTAVNPRPDLPGYQCKHIIRTATGSFVSGAAFSKDVSNRGADLYRATRSAVGGRFGSIQPLTVLNSAADEVMANPTFDGREFYFVRRSLCTYSDLYLSTRTTSGAWGPPRKLGAPFNVKNALYANPTTTADGLTLYFSMRIGCNGLNKAFQSRRAAIGRPWGTPSPVTAVQSVREAAHIVPWNNGQLLFFRGTVRSGGAWGWAWTQLDATTSKWSAPRVLPELIGVTHLSLDPVSGTMLETHFRNRKLAIFERSRVVPTLTVGGEPPASGLVINLSIGWDAVVARHEIAQGKVFRLVSYPWNAGYQNTLWMLSPGLSRQALQIAPFQYGLLVNPSLFVLGLNARSANGLMELDFAIPKNPAYAGLQVYFQNMSFNPRTFRGTFSEPLCVKIGT